MPRRLIIRDGGLTASRPSLNGFSFLGFVNGQLKKQIGSDILDVGGSGDVQSGITGATGATGSNGSQGPIGPQGVAGPVGPAGLYWQGAWSDSATYSLNFAVGFSGSSYFCIATVSNPTSSNPIQDTISWALLSSQGSPGPQGPQGIQGPQGTMGSPNIQSIPTTLTATPTSTNDMVAVTQQSTSLFLANPTGSWNQGQSLIIRIKDNGSPRAITYDTKYRAIGVTLPSATTSNMTIYLGIIYNYTDDKFDCIGVSKQ